LWNIQRHSDDDRFCLTDCSIFFSLWEAVVDSGRRRAFAVDMGRQTQVIQLIQV